MTVTLTLDMPSELAEQVHAVPPATLNRLVIAALPDVVNAAQEETEFDDPEDRDLSELPPLPAILTEPLYESLRKGFEAADAGRVIPGETVLAELRRRVGRE